MSSQIPSLDATALTLILFLAIQLYVRLTVVLLASLSNRYAKHVARQAKAPLTEDLIRSAALPHGTGGHDHSFTGDPEPGALQALTARLGKPGQLRHL